MLIVAHHGWAAKWYVHKNNNNVCSLLLFIFLLSCLSESNQRPLDLCDFWSLTNILLQSSALPTELRQAWMGCQYSIPIIRWYYLFKYFFTDINYNPRAFAITLCSLK